MVEIEDWVYDSTSAKKKTFTIKSTSLKKAIFRKVNKVYMNTGVFFQHSKTDSTASVSKSKSFK